MREINLKTNFVISIFFLLLVVPIHANTITVGLEGNYDCRTIQAGIDAASGWDTVLVAPGVYLVSEPITFRRKPLTVISEAGPDRTTIQMGRSRVDTNRSCVVIFEDMETQAFILDGFTITGGKGVRLLDTYMKYWHGGGIFFENSSATIKNCVIVRNSADEGGGVSCYLMSFPRFINCIITENSATSGGGGMQSYMSSPVLTNCTFTGNTVEGSGGGMSNDDSSPILTHCTFNGNSATSSGGGIVIASGSPILLDCAFIGNSSEFSGGGLINYSGDDISIITNCTFSGNSALYGGGGMCNWFEGNAILTNCTFNENWAEYGGGFDGIDYSNTTLIDCTFNNNRAEMGGGGLTNSSNNASLTNCTLNSNISENYGGGMYNSSSNLTMTKCTFSNNSVEQYGGGMSNYNCDLIIADCLFNSNSAQSHGGGICNWWGNNMTLNNCTFSDNQAERGGAMDNRSSDSVTSDCIFTSNRAGNDGGGISNGNGSLTINNSIFTGNMAAANGGALYGFSDSILTVTNCTFFGNLAQNGNTFASVYDRFSENITEIINCIIRDGVNAIWNSDDNSTIGIIYSNIRDGQAGIYDPHETVLWSEGNIDEDPCFTELGYWDPNGTPEDTNDDVWIDGDYHLKSQAGRYDPNSDSWVVDDVTSPCIDTGDPNSPVGDEPEPNGGRINMGAYGGTAEASKSFSN